MIPLLRHLTTVLFPAAVVLLTAGCGGPSDSSTAAAAERLAPAAGMYGSPEARVDIQRAMLTGTAADVRVAIDRAKGERGAWMGCPTIAVPRVIGDPTPAAPAAVRAVWNAIHAPGIAAAPLGRPYIGRQSGQVALGGWYAHRAGASVSLPQLAALAGNLRDQQCGPRTYSGGLTVPAGMFAYVIVPAQDPWYLGPLVGAGALMLEQNYPELAVTYTGGAFAGARFIVGDTLIDRDLVDGGAGYDQGFAGAMMVEAALAHPDARVRADCLAAAASAAEWSLSEPCVSNHNYTAKLIWLLAATYAATGETSYRDGCLDKLRRNVLPGVLMDRDGDGRVDGGPDIAFADLTAVARRPGRMWDGHNSLPWYHAKNTNAVVEAYVAFRDRGDTALAAEVRPYAIAMLDNLAWEIERLGVADGTAGFDNIPQPLLVGAWKIAHAESEPHPAWASAAWRLWSVGRGHGLGAFTLSAGLYLVVVEGVQYAPADSG